MGRALRHSGERRVDLDAACRVRDVVEGDDFFVLTGSYSIEALTNGNIAHNDVDANIFSRNVPRALARIGLRLSSQEVLPGSSSISTAKPDRLEYDIQQAESVGRNLELQFVNVAEIEESGEYTSFWLPSGDGREIKIPTVKRTLMTETGEALEFRVKTLPFAIATWALRISGVAAAQKRDVRQTDIDHFAFLAKSPHDVDEVIEAMQRHPQMPADGSAIDALEIALHRTSL